MKFAILMGIMEYFCQADLEVKVVQACQKVLFTSQFAVHEHHIGEAEILWFLDLIDTCS